MWQGEALRLTPDLTPPHKGEGEGEMIRVEVRVRGRRDSCKPVRIRFVVSAAYDEERGRHVRVRMRMHACTSFNAIGWTEPIGAT